MCSSGGSSKGSKLAAILQHQLGLEQLEIGREQLAWERDRAERQDPIIEEIARQQIDIGEVNQERSDQQWQVYKDFFQPIEERVAQDVMDWDSPERKERMAGEAAADVSRSYNAASESNMRRMMGFGVNPNDGRFQGMQTGIDIAKAGDTAGAMNLARRGVEKEGIAMRTGMAQLARGLPSTGLAADSTSLNAGNSATSNMATQTGMHNASVNAAAPWYGGAGNSFSSMGNIYNQIRSTNAQTSMANQNLLAEVAGTGIGAYAALRKGGVIKKGGKIDYSGYGISGSKKKVYKKQGKSSRPVGFKDGGVIKYKHGGVVPSTSDYGMNEQTGGMVDGEGTGTSDSVHGTIEGKKPVRLSDGEGILNAEAVEIVGEDFIHRINEFGIATGRRAA